MSLSDEAIYDIVAYVVSGETINPDSKPVPFSEYEYKCYSLAHHVWNSGFDETAEALCTGILFGDRKRLLEDALAAMLTSGAGAPGSGANNERAAHRRAIKARIEKLFGTSSQQPNRVTPIHHGELREPPKAYIAGDTFDYRHPHRGLLRVLATRSGRWTMPGNENSDLLFNDMSEEPARKVIPMTAASTLKTAADLVGGDRNASHGDMTENHQNIASLWEGYLGVPIKPHDVAVMMCLLKIARTKSGRTNPDDYVDLAGYAGIAAEIKGGENNA